MERVVEEITCTENMFYNGSGTRYISSGCSLTFLQNTLLSINKG
jgi:hypothetical protein